MKMALTTKELMLIDDNIKMAENSIKFMQGCAQMATDPQVKNICQQMVKEHQQGIQMLMKHINASSMH